MKLRCWILLGLFVAVPLIAADLKDAKVTAVINDVNLLPTAAAPRKAAVNDDVHRGTAVRTGVASRSELTFTDRTIARLGANTLFSFDEGTRNMELGGGAMLLRVPKDAGGAQIRTAAVTAAITGTTVMLQYDAKGYAKFVVLEGVACMSANANQADCVPVKAGQMLAVKVNPPPSSLPAPVDVDLKKLTESSKLLSSDFEPLPSLDLISQAVEEQKKETQDAGADANSKRSDEMLLTSLTDNITAVDQRTAVEDLTSATPTPTSTPTPTASPSPGEFSPPPTIASPNPYVITSSSVIKTDPSITTNGNTDFGTIYRDPEADGNRAQWLFGSVSEFDEASGFNSGVDTSTFLNNIAVFKFTNLQLSGDPTIDISNNGLTSLGLVGVNALSTNAPPGTTFHFSGIHTLLLATQNGPLTLGTGVSFSGTDRMFVYARGEGSALTLGSNVTTNNDLRLYSEGAANLSGAIHTTNFSSFSGGNFTSTSAITAPAIYINSLGNVVFNGGSANAEIFHVSAGGDLQIITPFALNAVTIDLASNGNLTWSGGIFPATTTNSNAGVSASANGTLHITGNLEIDRSSGDANGGMNVFLRGEIGIVIDGSLTTDLVPSLIDTGGSTQLNSDNDITIAGALSFNTEVRTNLSSGGDISVIAGGAISANSITANIKVDSNYSLGRADLSFFAEGNMTTNGGMNFAIDDSVGGKINGDASLMLIGNNISTNGNPFNATINNNAGTITGSTSESIIATGMFNAGDLTLQILNSDVGAAGTPGSISGLASILLNTVGSLSANSFTAIIDSRHRGSIESAASIEIGSQNGMTIAHDFQVGVTTSSQGSGGGTIGSNVSVGLSVDAGDGSVGGFLTSFIATNGGGRILGDALMQATVEGNLSARDGMLFTIEDTGFGNPGNNIIGGQIRGEASVSVQAQNILTTSDASGVPGTDEMALEFSIYSNVAGTIGGDALVSVGAVNRISAPGTIFFTVANGNYQELGPGAIGGNASINVSATDLFSGDLFAEIYNYEGASIGGSATVSLNLSGVLNASGDARLTIDNHAGRLTNGGSIQLTAASISANSFKAIIDNSNEGQMPSASIVTTLNGDATSTIVNDANFQIFGAQTPTSAITFNGGNYSVGGTFLSTIDGNGTLAFNNTSIAADVIKAGIFGANGALRIGGGTISADTILRLYAPGSSGLIEFVANTTLSNTSAAVVLAANTVTIDNNVRVTISGPQMALVYTSNANYTGSGGNGSTTGMFVGNGATTHPLSEAPPFDQTNPTQTIVYTGAANGNWSNASVWDPSVVPNNGNGQIYNASIASGFLVQDIFGGVTIETLFVSGGTLRLDNQLTLNAGLNFSGGTISSGPVAGGVLNIAGSSKQSAQMGLNGVTINNSGVYDITLDDSDIFNGGGDVFNNSGTLRKFGGSGSDNFNIPLNNTGTVIVLVGTLRITTTGSSAGIFSAAANAILDFANTYTFNNGATFSGPGTIQFENNVDAHINGTINNSGSILLNAGVNQTRLFLDSDSSLTGGGTVTLGSSNAQITGPRLLVNVDNTIQGQGNLGANATQFLNQAAGVIDANVSGLVLYVDPNGNGFNNQGTLRASNGGILQLSGNAGGGFGNSGTILASGVGSEVQLVAGVSVNGGTLSTANGGVIRTPDGETSFLSNLTNSGTFIDNNNADTHINGTINNTGSIRLNAGVNLARLVLDSDTTLTGGGTVTLATIEPLASNAQIAGPRLLTNFNNIIQGQGNLGANATQFLNQAAGLIDANVSAEVLFVDPNGNGFSNQGLMRASNGGILRLSGNAGGGFANSGSGSILATGSNSEVQLLQNASVTGGTLSTAGGGLFRTLSGETAFLSSLTIAGTFVTDNNADTHINGTINNTGTITLNAAANLSRLVLDSDSTLTGGGVVTLTSLDSNSNAQITGPRLLTNVDNRIQGQGNLGANATQFINQAAGLIDANVTGKILFVDPNGNGFSNQGLMRASNGGILQLSGNAGGGFANSASGSILATGPNSEVQLLQNASVSGGTLSTAGGGVFRTLSGQTAFLTSLTIVGTFIDDNNADTHINGTINNTGTITLNAAANQSRLVLDSDSVLTGGGIVTLTSQDANSNAQITGPRLLTNVNNTIQGQGNLGANAAQFLNQSAGLIDANVTSKLLFVDPNGNGFNNQGLMRASNGGILQLSGNAGGGFTNSGTILANGASSEVQLVNGASVSGGTLNTANGGVFRSVGGDSSTLSNLTNAGAFIVDNNSDLHINGTINNTGTITLNAAANLARLVLDSDSALTGGGIIQLASLDANSNAQITGPRLLINVDNHIQGEGNLGANSSQFLNQAAGLIDANVSGRVLFIDPNGNGLVNQGTMRASNNGILVLSGNAGGDFSNSGTIAAITGGTLRFDGNVSSSGTVDIGSDTLTATGNYTQTAGTFRLAGGSAQSNNALVFQGGLVDAFGDINASISNNAMLRPALGGSGLHVTGNVSLLSASNLVFQLGGLTQGSQYGFMNVNGNVSLGGQLLVSFVSGFQNSVTNSNSFTVLSSTATFSGIFANIASGSRLDTTDSAGSFLVTYNGSNVVLSDYQPHVPRPALKSPLANNAVKQLSGVGRDERTAGSGVATVRVAERNQVAQKTNGDPVEAERTTAARPARNVALDMKSSSQLLQLLDAAPAASAGGKINIDPAHAKRIAAGRVASNPVTSANRGRIDTGAKNRNDDTSANASSSRAEMSRTTVISRGATQ